MGNLERREPSDPDSTTSLELLAAELVRQISPEDPVAQIASAPSIQMADESPTEQPCSEVVASPKQDIVSNLPASAPPAPTATAVDAQLSNLLKAIVEPDIYTGRTDLDRAVALRWVLRDIKSDRLNWSPVAQYDLRILTIMGLVEMRDDTPFLTSAGVSAIA